MLNVCKRCRHYNKHVNKCWKCKKAWDEVQENVWNEVYYSNAILDTTKEAARKLMREVLDELHKREGEE